MKRYTFLLLGLLFVFNSSFAQTIQINSTDNLYYLCKIWGYLKYFHTEVGNGVIDWDEVLLQNINYVKNAQTESDLNTSLLRVINSAGMMEASADTLPEVPEELGYNLDLTWIDDEYLPLEIKDKLTNVRTLYRPFLSAYYSYTTDFKYNTDTYKENISKKYFAVFKYWNIINYFFPYKNLMDRNWNEVLKEFIVKIGSSRDADSYYHIMLELFAQINDGHASAYGAAIDELKGKYYIPVKLKLVEGNTIIYLTTFKSGEVCKPGDIIRKINGRDINKIRDSLRIYTNGSNNAYIERNINSWLVRQRSKLKTIRFEIEDETGMRTISVPLVSASEYSAAFSNTEPAWKTIYKGNRTFGYIHMGRLRVDQVPQMFNDLWNCDALIFDSRNYPLGTLWDLVGYLFPQPIHGAIFTIPDKSYPGTLKWVMNSLVGKGDFSKTYNNPIYLLFNEDTISQAEFTVMHLEQHPKAVKIGSQTAGADGNVELVLLPFDLSTYYSGLGVFYPDKRQTQRIGIVPDIEVKPTIQGIRDGRDEVLEAAFNHYSTTAVEKPNELPKQYSLMQNYPNPFNPATIIRYTIAETPYMASLPQVSLKVYDLLGREIATLVNEVKQPGNYSVKFSAGNLPSGVYLYQISAGNYKETKKLMLLK